MEEKMTNKKIWLGMLALALIFGMTVVGCGGDDDGDSTGNPNGGNSTAVPGVTLAEKMSWLQTNAQSNGKYTVEVSTDESNFSRTLSYSGKTNVSITLIGTDTGRTISRQSPPIFRVESGVILALGNNITLQGGSGDNSVIVVSDGGALVMNTGSIITGNRITGTNGGGVSVYNGGTFTMNGGTILGNQSTRGSSVTGGGGLGGGVYVQDGTFTMTGGKISGNTATGNGSGGGGICLRGGTFTMNGGEISGNTVTSNPSSTSGVYSHSGGGVYLMTGTFTMTGGKISGNTVTGRIDDGNYGGGVGTNAGTFTMTGGEISGNTVTRLGTSALIDNSGGGVFLATGVIFRLVSGTIYGSNETTTSLRNAATYGAALFKHPDAIAQYGTFSGGTWNKNGDLNTSNNTIKAVNGVLQ
jgi:hypothetical protein